MILEPMMLATAVATLHWGGHVPGGLASVPFAIIGYTIFIIFRGIFTRAEGTLESNRPLLYHRMVTILDMLVARALLEGAGVGSTLVILLAAAYAFDLSALPARPLWLIASALYMVWFSLGASMICCAATHDSRTVARLIHPATYLLMPLSGAFYALAWIPEPYRSWLSYFPMVHIFEIARYGQFENAKPDYMAPGYLTLWCLVLTFIGLLSIRIVRRHVHLS
jgi:capsular polysaccharide transport system permease protein